MRTSYRTKLIIFYIRLFATSLSACREKDIATYKEEFISNEAKFNKIITYLNTKYIYSEKYKDEIRLMFLNCSKYKRTIKHEKCDSILIREMNELGLSSIMVEDAEDDDIKFDNISFIVDNSDNSRVEYMYTPWGNNGKGYRNETIEVQSINEGWLISIDKSSGPDRYYHISK